MTDVRPERRKAPRADDPELRGRRSEPRAYLVLPAATEALSGHRHVTLLDISRAGARVEGAQLPEVGKDVVLKCGGVEAFGSIAWIAADRCGIHFDEPIPGRDLLTLRALAAEGSGSEMTYEEREAAEDWANGLAR